MSTGARHMDRRALFASAAAAALLAATGVSAGAPRRGGRLRMALSGASRSDDWQAGNGLFMQIARQGMVFDTLTEVAADGTLRAELAIDWQPTEAARIWTFDLRRGVRFHDGAPLTAADAVESLRSVVAGEIESRGRHRIRIALDRPAADLPLILARPDYVIRPAHAPDAGIGSGLYRVRRFTPGQQLLADRVPHHYKDGIAGWFEQVELTSIPAESVRGQALGEYLVDAVDLAAPGALRDVPDVIFMPDAQRPLQAVSRALAQPMQVSHLRPLDNLRAAERWWFA